MLIVTEHIVKKEKKYSDILIELLIKNAIVLYDVNGTFIGLVKINCPRRNTVVMSYHGEMLPML